MSGGERPKKQARGIGGWEEAGGEFFQESYPGTDADLDQVLSRDPKYFATLLPSKQNRATSKRPPPKPKTDRSTFKRRNSGYYTTMVANNTVRAQDIQVAMMPDLSENFATEESTWEEIMMIKSMPVNMAQKKDMKAKLLSAETFRLTGLKQFKWERRMFYHKLKLKWREFLRKNCLWNSNIRNIESNRGSGATSLFRLIKLLLFINFITSIIISGFLVLPTLLNSEGCFYLNETEYTNETNCCSFNDGSNLTFDILDIFQGTGWIQKTPISFNFYPSNTIYYPFLNYHIPTVLASITLAVYISLFLLVLKKCNIPFKRKLWQNEGQNYKFCYFLFSHYDYSLNNEKTVKYYQKSIFNEISDHLEFLRMYEEKRNDFHKLLIIRIIANSTVFLFTGGGCILSYYTFSYCYGEIEQGQKDFVYKIMLEFAPGLCVVALNWMLPNITNYFTCFERYSPINEKRINTFRAILVRFSILCFFLTSVFINIPSCETCLEGYYGRQIYKLLIIDIICHVGITFLISLPKMLIGKKISILANQELDLLKHCLDAIYWQTLIWIGFIFFPLLPILLIIPFFILFYLKKFAVLINYEPSNYRPNEDFTALLLVVSFLFSIIFFIYVVIQHTSPVWLIIQDLFKIAIKSVIVCRIALITTPILLFSFYYCKVQNSANRHMVDVLRKQLILEGHDKQFLLNRLSAFIRQHQHKAAVPRSVVSTES